LIEDEREGDDEVEEAEPFGAEVVRQDLDCVGDGERTERERVRRRKEKDEYDDGVARRGRPMLRILCKTDRLRQVARHHQTGRGEDEQSTPETVHRVGGVQSPHETPDLDAAIDEELGARIGNADLVQNFGQVVREETVAGPLGEESHGDDDPHAFSVTRGREERFPADVGSDGPVELEGGLDFLEFELHDGVLSKWISVRWKQSL
jgi:hypothetical protein